jgi:hypothetical protein
MEYQQVTPLFDKQHSKYAFSQTFQITEYLPTTSQVRLTAMVLNRIGGATVMALHRSCGVTAFKAGC